MLVIFTYKGCYEPKYLQKYLDEFAFRINRRKSASIGKKLMRIVHQIVVSSKITWGHSKWDMDQISEYSCTTIDLCRTGKLKIKTQSK